MKVYIASPYTLGDVTQNVQRQITTAEQLIDLGHTPYIPLLTHFWQLASPHEHQYWLDYDFNWLAVCDAVLRLDGASVGADMEVALAKRLGKQIYYAIADVLDGDLTKGSDV